MLIAAPLAGFRIEKPLTFIPIKFPSSTSELLSHFDVLQKEFVRKIALRMFINEKNFMKPHTVEL